MIATPKHPDPFTPPEESDLEAPRAPSPLARRWKRPVAIRRETLTVHHDGSETVADADDFDWSDSVTRAVAS